MLSDEVSAYLGASTRNFMTVQVEGDRKHIAFDRHRPESLTRKTARLTVWMFYSVLYGGKKAFGNFWEWSSMNSEKYDEYILSQVENFIGAEQRMGKLSWFRHDNAPFL